MALLVCGFMFSPGQTQVVLIRKNRPAWQAGRLNGVGGKVEPGETPLAAMVREFWEETGIRFEAWNSVLTMDDCHGDTIVFFRATSGHYASAYSKTDERIEIHNVDDLIRRSDVIRSIRWMVPMLLDTNTNQATVNYTRPKLEGNAA